MKTLIKKLIESIFNDEYNSDDIIDNDNTISDIILQEEIKKLSDNIHNSTEYPDNFSDLALAQEYAELGISLSEYIFKSSYGKEEDYQFKCKFKDYDNTLYYDEISFTYSNNHFTKDIKELTIYLDHYHIYDIVLNTAYATYSLKQNILSLQIFTLVQQIININKQYIIDNIKIDFPNGKKVKQIDIESPSSKDKTIITTDILNYISNITISTDFGETYNSIFKTYKTKYINFSSPSLKVDNFKTVYNIFSFFKKQGIKKMKMKYEFIDVENNTPIINNIDNILDLFNYFCIKNNIEQYQFSNKSEIEDVLFYKVMNYLDKYYTNIRKTTCTIKTETIEKDEKGQYANIFINHDTYINEKFTYFIFHYKFYKTGYYELIGLKRNSKDEEIKEINDLYYLD